MILATNDLATWAQAAANVMWRASWQASVLVLFVLMAQWALGKRLPARWRYNLWLVVLVRLALPVTPSSSWSVFNLMPDRRAPVTMSQPAQPRIAEARMTPRTVVPVEPLGAVHFVATRHPASQPAIVDKEPAPFPWYLLLGAGWLLGVLLLSGRIAWATMRLHLAVRRLAAVHDPAVLDVLERAAGEMGVARRVRVLEAPMIASPALMGAWRPRLLLPPGVLASFDARELRLIFLHELAHLQRNDVAVNWVMTLLLVVHWFNPIVWLALGRMRQDRELACDEMVLSLSQDRRAYGQTILKLLDRLSKRQMVPGMIGILEGAQPLRRRITMIAAFERRGRWWAMGALASMIVIGCVALTDSVKNPPQASATESDAKRPARQAPAGVTSSTPAAAAQDPFEAEQKKVRIDHAYVELKANQLRARTQNNPSPSDLAEAKVQNEKAKDLQAKVAALEVRMADARRPMTIRTAPARFREEIADETMAKLQKKLPEVRFDSIPLSDVLDFVRDAADLNLVVNRSAMEAAGVDANTPITLRLRDVTVEQTLEHLGRQAGGGTIELGIMIEGNTVTFSTEEDISKHVNIKAYNVQDLVASATTRPTAEGQRDALDSLVRVITENVAPESWTESGGTVGTIGTFGNTLVVKNTPANQLELERLLEKLREARSSGGFSLTSDLNVVPSAVAFPQTPGPVTGTLNATPGVGTGTGGTSHWTYPQLKAAATQPAVTPATQPRSR